MKTVMEAVRLSVGPMHCFYGSGSARERPNVEK